MNTKDIIENMLKIYAPLGDILNLCRGKEDCKYQCDNNRCSKWWKFVLTDENIKNKCEMFLAIVQNTENFLKIIKDPKKFNDILDC